MLEGIRANEVTPNVGYETGSPLDLGKMLFFAILGDNGQFFSGIMGFWEPSYSFVKNLWKLTVWIAVQLQPRKTEHLSFPDSGQPHLKLV